MYLFSFRNVIIVKIHMSDTNTSGYSDHAKFYQFHVYLEVKIYQLRGGKHGFCGLRIYGCEKPKKFRNVFRVKEMILNLVRITYTDTFAFTMELIRTSRYTL